MFRVSPELVRILCIDAVRRIFMLGSRLLTPAAPVEILSSNYKSVTSFTGAPTGLSSTKIF